MKVAILFSGRGSNLAALLEASRSGKLPNADLALGVTDQPAAGGLMPAANFGLETVVVARNGRKRTDHDAEIVEVFQKHGVDLVCLAGYMRLLSPEFIAAFPGRILNIHPSLLPSFPGLHAQRQALESGVKWSGCTVHFVDESLDGGPIIAQAAVPVLDEDTEETLTARILAEEHRLYAEALDLVSSGQVELVGRRVLRRAIVGSAE